MADDGSNLGGYEAFRKDDSDDEDSLAVDKFDGGAGFDVNGGDSEGEAVVVGNSEDELELSDSENETEAKADGGKRDTEAVHRRQVARAKKKRAERNVIVNFEMPKISKLRKAAGLIPTTPPLTKARQKANKKAQDADAGTGAFSEMVDSAKEVLAYFAGEESYETRPIFIEDIPSVLGNIYHTNRRRFLINWLPGDFYKLNLSGFDRYYKPASKTLLVACKSRFIKPFLIADLLEEGADPNVMEEGTDNRPLHFLCRRGNLKGVRILVQAGADPLAFNAAHRNALISASDTGRTADQCRIVRYLLSLPGVRQSIEERDSGGNTAAISAIFKQNVWILRDLLRAGARVTEEDPKMGYESAHDIAAWVYAAGLLMDVDQLPVMATQYPEDMNCMWHTFSMKGHWYYSPLLLAQTFFKYGADLCYRICQNKKRDEDAIEYTPKGRRAVQIMADKRAEAREKRLVDRELASARKYAHQRKLISRKLENEVRELDEWNSLRKQFAARIDGQFKKGLRGQDKKDSYEYVSKQFSEKGGKQWEKQLKTGSFYMSDAPPSPPTKLKKLHLEKLIEERHNRTHNGTDQIHIFDGKPAEMAYARASWVEKDHPKEESKGLDGSTVSEGQQGKGTKKKKEGNGWKLAARAGDLGLIDHESQWAKNKTILPFIQPPTEEEVYLSSDSDDAYNSPTNPNRNRNRNRGNNNNNNSNSSGDGVEVEV